MFMVEDVVDIQAFAPEHLNSRNVSGGPFQKRVLPVRHDEGIPDLQFL